jgi:hypothetical protein
MNALSLESWLHPPPEFSSGVLPAPPLAFPLPPAGVCAHASTRGVDGADANDGVPVIEPVCPPVSPPAPEPLVKPPICVMPRARSAAATAAAPASANEGVDAPAANDG